MDVTVTPELMREARGWLDDCGFPDLIEAGGAQELTDTQVVRGVARLHEGGWAAFAAAAA